MIARVIKLKKFSLDYSNPYNFSFLHIRRTMCCDNVDVKHRESTNFHLCFLVILLFDCLPHYDE